MEFQPQVLRLARKNAGLTQCALATKAGVAPATIHYLEVGHVKGPRATTLLKVANALGVDLQSFFATTSLNLLSEGRAHAS